MGKESLFICECGSTVLALSHTWTSRSKVEQVGFAGEDGRYTLDVAKELDRQDIEHEWLAYCGGCGKGVTVEWLEQGRVRLLLEK